MEKIRISEYVLSGAKDLVVFNDKEEFDKHFGEQDVWYMIDGNGRAYVTGENAVFTCENYEPATNPSDD